jgi:hypothetical protein
MALAVLPGAPSAAPVKLKNLANPEFTQGETIPAGAPHDWNLGATGARGWIHCDKLATTDARQVFITQVAKGSPADGVLAAGDVILGAWYFDLARRWNGSFAHEGPPERPP